jgi:hypothetical protein
VELDVELDVPLSHWLISIGFTPKKNNTREMRINHRVKTMP